MMIGSRTGWDYHTDRVSFLRQMYNSEQRQRETDNGLSPRSLRDYRRMPESPGIAPGLSTAHQRLNATASLRPVREAPAAAPAETITLESSKESASALAAPITPRELTFPAVSTTAQMAFGAHDPDFLQRFRSNTTDNGKMHDTTTQFREAVFTVCHTTALSPQPARVCGHRDVTPNLTTGTSPAGVEHHRQQKTRLLPLRSAGIALWAESAQSRPLRVASVMT